MARKSRLKANWTPGHRKIFFDLCLDEVSKGNKPGTHFTREGWKNLIASFYEKTGIRYSKRQMKNHWDATKKHWKIWIKLIAEDSMKWDPQTNKFGASIENWANYIQVIPEAAQFQYKELPCPDILKIVFAGNVNSQVTEPSNSPGMQSCNSDNSLSHSEEQEFVTGEGVDEQISYAVPLRSYDMGQSKHCRTTASEQSISSSSHPKAKAKAKAKAVWSPAACGDFLDLCVEETLKGNKPGSHFTKGGWKTIVESFQQKTGLMYNRVQLKNRWHITKEQWRIWCKLIGTRSMGWDPNARRFRADDEDWANYLELYPEAAPFRFKEPLFSDKLEILFGGATVTGETEPLARRRKYNDDLKESFMQVGEGGIENKEGNTQSLDGVTVAFPPGKLTYSIGECIACLDAMGEIEQGSELYLFALDVFLKKEYREVFLQLKSPGVRIAWLQRLQSIGPPLS